MSDLLGSFILNRRKELGLSQKDIAEYLNVSIPTVSLWEKNERLPDLSLLGSLARLLKIDFESLINHKNEINNDYDLNNEFDINNFALYFKQQRKINNLSLVTLASKLNIRYQKISKWENKESLPGIEELKECAKIFNISIFNLYYGKDLIKKENIIIKKSNRSSYIAIFLPIISLFIILAALNIKDKGVNNNSSSGISSSSDKIIVSSSSSNSSSPNVIISSSTSNDVISSSSNSSSSNVIISSSTSNDVISNSNTSSSSISSASSSNITSSSSNIISSSSSSLTSSSSSLTQEYIEDLKAFEQVEVNFYSYYTSLYVNINTHSLTYDETKRFDVLVYLGDELVVNSPVTNDDIICVLKLGKNYTIKLKYGSATKTYYTDYRVTYTAIPSDGICVELIGDYLSAVNLYYSMNNTITIPESYEGYKVIKIGSDFSNNSESSIIEKIYIPSSIEVIEEDAFKNFNNLKEVHYDGTLEQWNKIEFENEYSNPFCNGAILITNDDIPAISNELADEEYQNLGGDAVINELLISKTSIAIFGDYTLDNQINNIELYDDENLLCSSNTIDVIFINLKSNHKYKIIISFDGLDITYTKEITTLAE